MTTKAYVPAEHVRDNLTAAADEAAVFTRKLLTGAVENSKENRELAQIARGMAGSFTRFEATLSARDQTSVVVSKLLSGEDPDEFKRYIAAAMPDHAAVRIVTPGLSSGE